MPSGADDQLLERFVACQDAEAFAALVERYGPLVMGVCRRTLGDPHDADDAFQATFLVFARRAGSIRNQGLVGSWLCGTAYRISLKARVAAARRRAQERQAGQMPKHDSQLEAAWKELRPILDEELNQLPEKYRVPLVLCYLEGKSNEAAAKELGWPAGSMSYRLTKARELLKARLVKRGVAVSTALIGPALATYATTAVPAALAQPTIQAGLLFSAGQTVATVVSTSAVSLAEGVLHGIHLVKMLLVGLGILSVAVVAGTGIYLLQPGPETQIASVVTPLDGELRVRVQFTDSQRFGIALTKLRDPRNAAELKRLTRDANGQTGNTRYRIDGSEYLFGGDLIENQWVREAGRLLREAPIPQRPTDRAWQSVLEHGRSKVRIAQQVEIVVGEQTRLYDTVLVRYVIENHDSRPHVVGLRTLVDTLIGNNDGVPFLIPNDAGYLLENWAEFDRDRVPAFIRALESGNLNDPTATVAEMGLRLKGVEPIDRLVICRWPDSPDARWGGTNRPGDWQYEPISANPMNPDSCVLLYWAEREMKLGEKRELAFTYGLGRISNGQGGPREQIRLLTAGSSGRGRTFTATAYFQGLPPGQKARIDLPAGLELAEGQAAEKPVPPPSQQGYSQVSWKVKATQAGEHEISIFVAGWHTVREIVHIREKSLFD